MAVRTAFSALAPGLRPDTVVLRDLPAETLGWQPGRPPPNTDVEEIDMQVAIEDPYALPEEFFPTCWREHCHDCIRQWLETMGRLTCVAL